MKEGKTDQTPVILDSWLLNYATMGGDLECTDGELHMEHTDSFGLETEYLPSDIVAIFYKYFISSEEGFVKRSVL